ncbi:MAG: AraC family transcriptional regulator [Fimbriimonas sp.]|nr:AraC family transcriptional regulator [Fimbriimonas sp.]
MTYLRLEHITGTVTRTSTGYLVVPTGMCALCINLKGTLIVRSGVQGKLVLVPPRSITFVRGAKLIVQAARGEHLSQLLSWEGRVTPLLDNWIAGRIGRPNSLFARSVACKPIDPHFKGAIARYDHAITQANETMEPSVVSVVYEIASRLMTSTDQVQLAAVPSDLPDTIRDLIARVRQNPAHGWPLRDAADAAGYSPFHFSRVFKNLVGYGFHEYVDRCRTEAAVDLLCTTDQAVDLVASTCGFGTTQGLRESVKEYLGLVPSELRTIPEAPINGLD